MRALSGDESVSLAQIHANPISTLIPTPPPSATLDERTGRQELTLRLLGWTRELKLIKHGGMAGLVCCRPNRCSALSSPPHQPPYASDLPLPSPLLTNILRPSTALSSPHYRPSLSITNSTALSSPYQTHWDAKKNALFSLHFPWGPHLRCPLVSPPDVSPTCSLASPCLQWSRGGRKLCRQGRRRSQCRATRGRSVARHQQRGMWPHCRLSGFGGGLALPSTLAPSSRRP